MSNQKFWEEQYEVRGAYWIHDGNPKRPHALLTSGEHSSGFFNSELVMENPTLLDHACHDLTELLRQYNVLDNEIIDRVVGPAMGAITVAHDMARHISRRCLYMCNRAYVEKMDNNGQKIMIFNRTKIHPGERILISEDVLTSGKSVELTATASIDAGGIVLPFVVVLVNRSGLSEINGKKILALIDRHMPKWMPDECPLCKAGSEAIRPKSKENWDRLNASY